jgi:hypothetical protein
MGRKEKESPETRSFGRGGALQLARGGGVLLLCFRTQKENKDERKESLGKKGKDAWHRGARFLSSQTQNRILI